MNIDLSNNCDIAQSPGVSITQHTVDLPKLAVHKRHALESNSASEGLPYKTKSSLISRTGNASHRYSTNSLTPKRFTPFPSTTRFPPTDHSLRSVRMPSPEDALQQDATVFEPPKFKLISSLKGVNGLDQQPPWISLPIGRKSIFLEKTSSDKFKLPEDRGKARNCRTEQGDRTMGSSYVRRIDDGQNRFSMDIIPNRRSSLRNQHLSTDESQFRRSNLIGARTEHDAYSMTPIDPTPSTQKICNSWVAVDFDDKVEKRISQLKTLKKQRNSDYTHKSTKGISSDQSIEEERVSSQIIVAAEDKDRISRAYEHLGLPNTSMEPSKGISKTVASVDDIPNLSPSMSKSLHSTDTACDTFSLKKALGAIEDTPNLSLDIVHFNTANAGNERLFISKRNSIRRPFRSQQRPCGERKKSLTAGSDRSDSPRLSKRFSHLTMESLTALTRRPQHHCIDKDIDQDIQSFLADQRLSQIVRHPRSGRKISFSEVGDPKGHAVLCCVGMGLTRFATVFYDDLARSLRLRLITPDRPGIGDSEKHQDDGGVPLNWSEDVLAICSHLRINKFSILAHSAGAIYALATALCVPEHVEGRIHLLAPWITPSQMTEASTFIGTSTGGQLPRSQRILKALPARLLRVANASFMPATSSSLTRTTSDSPQHFRSQGSLGSTGQFPMNNVPLVAADGGHRNNILRMDRISFNECNRSSPTSVDRSTLRNEQTGRKYQHCSDNRQSKFDMRLTLAIWDAATSNANPAVDLLVCLERYRTIGFRYTDVDLPIVIRHGLQDTRVPIENAKWLAGMMRNCEMRTIGDEGHGLMASAAIMGEVLTEVAKEPAKS